MNRWMSAALSGVLLLGLTVPSHAIDQFGQYLPQRGSVQASVTRAFDRFKATGGRSGMTRDAPGFAMTWENPDRTVSIIPEAATTEGQKIGMTCVSVEAPPAAEQFCAELLRLYQK